MCWCTGVGIYRSRRPISGRRPGARSTGSRSSRRYVCSCSVLRSDSVRSLSHSLPNSLLPLAPLVPCSSVPRAECTDCFLFLGALTVGGYIGYRQYLIHLNGKLRRGEIEPFETNEKAVERSAEYVSFSLASVLCHPLPRNRPFCESEMLTCMCDCGCHCHCSLVHASVVEEKKMVHSFQYLY